MLILDFPPGATGITMSTFEGNSDAKSKKVRGRSELRLALRPLPMTSAHCYRHQLMFQLLHSSPTPRLISLKRPSRMALALRPCIWLKTSMELWVPGYLLAKPWGVSWGVQGSDCLSFSPACHPLSVYSVFHINRI